MVVLKHLEQSPNLIVLAAKQAPRLVQKPLQFTQLCEVISMLTAPLLQIPVDVLRHVPKRCEGSPENDFPSPVRQMHVSLSLSLIFSKYGVVAAPCTVPFAKRRKRARSEPRLLA